MQWLMDGQRCHPAVDNRGPTLDQGQCNIKGGGCQLATLSCCLFMETWYNGAVVSGLAAQARPEADPGAGGASLFCQTGARPMPGAGLFFPAP